MIWRAKRLGLRQPTGHTDGADPSACSHTQRACPTPAFWQRRLRQPSDAAQRAQKKPRPGSGGVGGSNGTLREPGSLEFQADALGRAAGEQAVVGEHRIAPDLAVEHFLALQLGVLAGLGLDDDEFALVAEGDDVVA